MADFPRYTWDRLSGRYRSKRTGRFVPPAAVQRALQAATENEMRRARDAADQFRAGALSQRAWEATMRETVKSTQLYSGALARGGWAQLTPADYGRIGQRIRFHYGKLAVFAAELEAGTPRDGRFLQRAEQYVRAAGPTYHLVREVALSEAGFDQVRSLLHVAEHCEDCEREAAKGWQPIGAMVPIGERACLANDRCSLEYRNSRTGEVIAA